MTIDFMIIDPSDQNRIEDFEKSIYQNFIVKNEDKWIKENYIITGNSSVRPYIDYSKQIIYAGYVEGQLLIGCSINISQDHFQIVDIAGKHINFQITPEHCEGLVYFFNPYNLGDKVKIGFDFESFFYNDLKKRGYRYIIGTCFEKELRLYILLGWKLQNEYLSAYGKEFIILKDLSE